MKEDAGSDLETIGNEVLKYPAALSISYTSSTAGQVERMLGLPRSGDLGPDHFCRNAGICGTV